MSILVIIVILRSLFYICEELAIRMKGVVIILKRWNLEIHFMLGLEY